MEENSIFWEKQFKMKQSVSVPYGKITFGTIGKNQLHDEKMGDRMFPKSAWDWFTYTKEIFSEIYPNPSYQVHSLQQVHGDSIEEIPLDADKKSFNEMKDGDGLFCIQEKQILVVRTADCVPVYLYSKKQPLVCMIHSGWKGTTLGITEKMIQSLLDQGYSIEELVMELGPYIQRSNYEVREDVANLFLELGPDVCYPKVDGKYLLDVGLAIERRVKRAFGDKLFVSNQKNEVFQSPLYFSHRAKEEGRNLNFILWES